jgi:hypothetical protein
MTLFDNIEDGQLLRPLQAVQLLALPVCVALEMMLASSRIDQRVQILVTIL